MVSFVTSSSPVEGLKKQWLAVTAQFVEIRVAAQPPGFAPVVPLKSKAAIQGYSFTSVSVPPTILLVFFTPHLQVPEAEVLATEMGVLALPLVVVAALLPLVVVAELAAALPPDDVVALPPVLPLLPEQKEAPPLALIFWSTHSL
jgi:hypothetical protein